MNIFEIPHFSWIFFVQFLIFLILRSVNYHIFRFRMTTRWLVYLLWFLHSAKWCDWYPFTHLVYFIFWTGCVYNPSKWLHFPSGSVSDKWKKNVLASIECVVNTYIQTVQHYSIALVLWHIIVCKILWPFRWNQFFFFSSYFGCDKIKSIGQLAGICVWKSQIVVMLNCSLDDSNDVNTKTSVV